MTDSNNHKRYLGIDTGGTFTDGVIFDPASRRVLASTKVLTTHHNLKTCIAAVLEQLAPTDPTAIALVSLSTTLATNAIAEGKRKPVGLLLLGYDPDLVYRFNFHQQFGTEHFCFIGGAHGLDGVEQAVLDEAEVLQAARRLQDQVDAFAIVSYAGPMNPAHEERAAALVAEVTGKPVVQAHHLSSELDSIRRAVTASLNASLLANIQEFMQAVQQMLAGYGIACPVMMVRGDGSIVKAGFARQRPVEIIHSGPATSAVGGHYLSGVETALVVDIGGTTTDIALVEQGKTLVETGAATVGPYRTCVRTIRVRSFGIGGDSLIRFDRKRSLTVGPERALPLSRLCHEYPAVKADLLAWLEASEEIPSSDKLEYWVLRREPAHPFRDRRTQKALELLRQGPQRLSTLLKYAGAVSPVQVDSHELFNQEIIERAGLTPTDLLHISGEFAPWDTNTVQRVVARVAHLWDESPSAFYERVKRLIRDRITAEIVEFLSGRTLSEPSFLTSGSAGSLDRWLFEESLAPANPYLGSAIRLKTPLVAIGAPAQVFLPPVAKALDTQIILPEHYAVANAVGTVVGKVIVRHEAEVFPWVEGSAAKGFYARAANQQQRFTQIEDAITFARQALIIQAEEESRAAGAEGAPVEIEERETLPGMVRLTAWAIASPEERLSGT
ncbi:MAG TPA: hydantoinase/oxoprolinase family protein [Anaerolineaceae bacterium]